MGDITPIRTAARKLAELLATELSKFSGVAPCDVSLDSPAVLLSQKGGITRSVLSVFLYRIEVDTASRNLPPRKGPEGIRPSTPSLRLNLQFLLTPIAQQADETHLLLNAAMDILNSTPMVPIDPGTQPAKTLEVVPNPLPLGDMAQLWLAFGTPFRLSATYTARLR